MQDRDIIDALGGHDFIWRCVNTAERITRGVLFKLPPGATMRPKLAEVTVTMERNDGYSMRSYRRREGTLQQVAERHEIETSALKSCWQDLTGMDPDKGWLNAAIARLPEYRPLSPADEAFNRTMREMREALPHVAPKPRVLLPPRLLFMACSATKNPSPASDIDARDRYTGSWWNVLRKADPTRSTCAVAFLSAKLGMGDANYPIPYYERKMTRQTGEQMIERGILEGWPPPQGKQLNKRTIGGISPAGHMHGLRQRIGDGPFQEVAIVGGHLYQPVMQAYVAAFQRRGDIAPDARITVIQDQIGFMLQRVKAWIGEAS